jgi:hypothetical protein
MEAILYEIGRRPSGRTQGIVYRLNWVSIPDLISYRMYVDTGYGNYRLWRDIIQLQQLGIYADLQLAKTATAAQDILDADHRPQRLYAPLDMQTIIELVQELSTQSVPINKNAYDTKSQ